MRLPPGLSIRKVACPSQVRVPLAMPAAYRWRNVRLVGEAHGVALRLAAPGLAGLALASWLAGVDGLASLVLLAAIVTASVRLILTVGDVVEGKSDRRPVVLSVAGVACLVAAGAAHLPLLVFGLLVCSALELLVSPPARRVVLAEPVELVEAPVSRAA